MALHLKATGLDFADFSDANTMTTELIADYEEGTYSPTLCGQSNADGQGYSGQQGIYLKVGAWITVNSYSTLSTLGNLYGNYPACGGIPFTAGNSGDGGIDSGACAIARVERVKISSNWVGPHVQVSAGTTFLMMEATANGNANNSHRSVGNSYGSPAGALTNTSSIAMAGWYREAV